jgi:glucosamine-6-phosphate deaminase
MQNSFEKIPIQILDDHIQAASWIAETIATLITEKKQKGEFAVIGLATGSTPTNVYKELVKRHKTEGLSFKNVITFNLDEYYPMEPYKLQSYVRFMNEHLFNHIDIDPKNIHIPDGTIAKEDITDFCTNYEAKIEKVGGIDIQLLGIGRNGHIGFNEPGSDRNSKTRLITLEHSTIADAASDFYGEDDVPRRAVTMGISTILKARKIILMALGEGKSKIIREAVEGPITNHVPASFLQKHPNTIVLLDKASANDLTRSKTPWLAENCNWQDARLVRKAVVWLCQKTNKPILKLTDQDYNSNGMIDLLALEGSSNKINIKVFNDLQRTITGWPGGKPKADNSNRPERELPYPKRVLLFSPHPDDDVISMGGTFLRLVEQKHEVYTAYQTSGSIAVHDDDVLRHLDFVVDASEAFGLGDNKQELLSREILEALKMKKPGDTDPENVRQIKTLIRRSEAKAACRYAGVKSENVFFLDMPFYDTGTIVKKELSQEDIQIIVDLLRKIQPHQIFAAGDLSDPHGTHRVCLQAIFKALEVVKNEQWTDDCYVWLYRGAWQEWEIADIDMAVPISPDELLRKRKSIFKHQSQKDKALFPGIDEREFWQRAEERNRTTAKLYDQLGMAEYEAIEAFVRYFFK